MLQGKRDGMGELVLVALGGNQASRAGSPASTVAQALERLGTFFTDVTSSKIYKTPAFPPGSGADFSNAACRFRSDLRPSAILEALHEIEAEFDRQREVRWGQRTLDLDLLAVGDTVAPDLPTFEHWRGLPLEAQTRQAPDQLILPHPRLQDRAFVLVPLADVAPDWRHPVLEQSVLQMRDALDPSDLSEVVALNEWESACHMGVKPLGSRP